MTWMILRTMISNFNVTILNTKIKIGKKSVVFHFLNKKGISNIVPFFATKTNFCFLSLNFGITYLLKYRTSFIALGKSKACFTISLVMDVSSEMNKELVSWGFTSY